MVIAVTRHPIPAYPIPHGVGRETFENSMECLPTGNKRTHETVIVILSVYHHAVICLYYAVLYRAIGLQKRLNNTCYEKARRSATRGVIRGKAILLDPLLYKVT